MMPKSTATIRPSASTKALPGCWSAWKKPSRNTWLKNTAAALPRISVGSWPASIRRSRWSTGMPWIRSRVSTRRPVRSQSTAGVRKVGSSAKFSASSRAAAASMRRSISSRVESAKVLTTSTGLSRRRSGRIRCTRPAIQYSRSRSRAKAASISGRSTLIATSRPSAVTAKWTWAMDAAAAALSSNCLYSSPTGRPSSSSIMRRAAVPSKGGSRSCNAARSLATCSPSRSGRVESIWPSLMKVGPRR